MEPDSLSSPLPFKDSDLRVKKVKFYKEIDEDRRVEFREKISALPLESLVFIDEIGIDSYIFREFGRAPRGLKIKGVVSKNDTKEQI